MKNKENAAFVTTNSDSRRPLGELQIQACDPDAHAETVKRKSRWAADIEFRLTLFEEQNGENHGVDRGCGGVRKDDRNRDRNDENAVPSIEIREVPDLERQGAEGAVEQISNCSDPHNQQDQHITKPQLQLKSARPPMEDRPTLSDLSDLPALPSFGGRNLHQLAAEILQNEQAHPEQANPSEGAEGSAPSAQGKEKHAKHEKRSKGMIRRGRGMAEVDRRETKSSSPDFRDLQHESELACDSSESPEWPTPPESPILRKQRKERSAEITTASEAQQLLREDQDHDVDGETGNVDNAFSFAVSKGDEETLELPKSPVDPQPQPSLLEMLDAPKVRNNEHVDHFDNFDVDTVDTIDTCLDNTFDSEAQSILQSMMCISQLQSRRQDKLVETQNRQRYQPLSRAARLISARAVKVAAQVGEVVERDGKDGEDAEDKEEKREAGENAEHLDLELDMSSNSSTSSQLGGRRNLTFGSRTLEPLPSWNFDTLRGYLNTFQRCKLRQQQREERLQQLQKQCVQVSKVSSATKDVKMCSVWNSEGDRQKVQKQRPREGSRGLFFQRIARENSRERQGEAVAGRGIQASVSPRVSSPRRAPSVTDVKKSYTPYTPKAPKGHDGESKSSKHCQLESSKSVPLLGPMQVHSRGEAWLENRKKRQYLLREEARKEELRECTFKPQLSETLCFKVQLPTSPRSPRSPRSFEVRVVSKEDRDLDLYDRQMQWRRKLDERWDEERQRKKQMELQEEQEQRRCQSCRKKCSRNLHPNLGRGSECERSPRTPRDVDAAFERFHERSRQWQAARELRALQAVQAIQAQCTCQCTCELRPTINPQIRCKDEKDGKDGKGGKACTQSCVSLKPREPKGGKDTSKAGKQSTKFAKEAEANTKCRARSEEPKCRDTPRSKAERQEVLSHLQALRRALFDSKQLQDGTLPRWQKALQVEVARSHGAGAAPRAASRGL